MNILFDTTIFDAQKYGGVSRYHIELAKQFSSEYSDKVTIPIFITQNAYLAQYKNKKLWDIRSKQLGILVRKGNTLQTMAEIMFGQHDIVHLTWYHPRIIQLSKNKKVVITIHDMIHELFGIDQTTIEYKKQAIYSADGIIAISESTKSDLLRLYPDVPEDKINVIYHGTNHLGQAIAPTSFTLPKKYILYVGTRFSYKNARFVMESLSEKLCSDRNLHLVFAGGGKFSEEEEELLNTLGIRRQVQQHYVTDSELAYIYEHAICFVYPSLYEGFGFPILEAFDNHCPVICSSTSSLPEVGGEAALYFSPDNKEEFLNHVTSLLSDEDKRQHYIQLGSERVKRFTWKNTAQETRDVYKKII